MPKLYSAREVLSALRKDGFEQLTQKGSHVKLLKKQKERNLVVIVPIHKQIAYGTFQSILKQANLTKKKFENLVK